MKVRRDVVVARLREKGLDEEADRAERELPERVNVGRLEGKLRSLGLGPSQQSIGGGGGPGWGAAAGGADFGGGGDGGGG